MPEVFAGGTEIYFTEVNRARPDLSGWDGLCFSITPQIHAFTDIDVVENLDAQGENVRSARCHRRGKARDRLAHHHAQARQLPCRRRPTADAARRAARLGRRPAVVAVRRGLDGGKPEVHLGVGCLVGDLLRDDRLARSRRARRRFGAAGEVPLGGGRGVPAVPPARRRWQSGVGRRCSPARRATCSPQSGSRCARPTRRAGCSSRTSRRPSGRWSSGRSMGAVVAPAERGDRRAGGVRSGGVPRRAAEAASADGELELTLAPYEVVRIDPAVVTVETRCGRWRLPSSAGSRSRAVPVGHRLHRGAGAKDETVPPTRRCELGPDRRTGRGHAARDRQGRHVGEAQQVRVRDDGGGRVDRVRSARSEARRPGSSEAAAGRPRESASSTVSAKRDCSRRSARSASASTSAASANLRLVPSSNSSGVSATASR